MNDCIRCNRSAMFCAEHMSEAMREKSAVIDDLKARLKALRHEFLTHVENTCDSSGNGPERELFERATDLRVRAWRKP